MPYEDAGYRAQAERVPSQAHNFQGIADTAAFAGNIDDG